MKHLILRSLQGPRRLVGLLTVLLAVGFIPWVSMEAATGKVVGQVPGSPKIECDEPLVEWGELIKETPFTHDFEIRNTGDEVLIIKKVNGT
ncbi:MAG: hypothetical protein CBC13_06550 [Planctomycetia bacterium TMED53]|nr:MAG: hypothetical protein CBC13_06550 [Planctomycetia bacterium TMED53]